MRKEIIICDKCGAEINELFWHAGLINDGDYMSEERLDICDLCMNKFLYPDPVHPDPVEPKPKQTKKRKPLDHGKMQALRNAGWSYQAIADEVGCSIGTAHRILNEAEDEQK